MCLSRSRSVSAYAVNSARGLPSCDQVLVTVVARSREYIARVVEAVGQVL